MIVDTCSDHAAIYCMWYSLRYGTLTTWLILATQGVWRPSNVFSSCCLIAGIQYGACVTRGLHKHACSRTERVEGGVSLYHLWTFEPVNIGVYIPCFDPMGIQPGKAVIRFPADRHLLTSNTFNITCCHACIPSMYMHLYTYYDPIGVCE